MPSFALRDIGLIGDGIRLRGRALRERIAVAHELLRRNRALRPVAAGDDDIALDVDAVGLQCVGNLLAAEIGAGDGVTARGASGVVDDDGPHDQVLCGIVPTVFSESVTRWFRYATCSRDCFHRPLRQRYPPDLNHHQRCRQARHRM